MTAAASLIGDAQRDVQNDLARRPPAPTDHLRIRGRYREACPVILGYSSDGRERVLVFQIGGQTRPGSNLPGWRSFRLADVHDLKLRDGPWAEGDSHTRTQSHIRFVDVDVNIPATLTRLQPLPFGSPELLPPRGG